MASLELPEAFYRTPESARTTMTREKLRELLLKTDARVMACGCMWTIVSKPIGAGVYEVTLRRTHGGSDG